ncbi:apolipoprotein N-acyltransferase [Oceanibium sediminis]|uniref:apolipoprotein N-acyltransferase n=1 Tax=Oceanibium sediminis TaxID=2026339 RepID=UPI000DD4DEA5|nr:apolipoprotein N-acyltransferase [Oceanibium sediminis]
MTLVQRAESWCAARSRRARAFLAVLTGLAMALGQAPIDFPYLWVLAVPLLLWLWRSAPSARSAAALGWLAGAGYFGLSLTWIVEPFFVDVARHGWMAPFALLGMAGGLALFWALGFFLARRLASGRGWWDPLVMAAALTLAEGARSYVFTGFPWALPAYAWVETPVVQAASLVGPHGLGAVMLALMALPGLLRPVPVVLAALGVAALWVGGTMRLATPTETVAGPVVRLVQPNAAQHLKWAPEMVPVFFARLMDSTAAPAAGEAPDVVIWPETAVPFLLGERPGLMERISTAAGGAVPVVLGIRRFDPDQGWFNALAVIGPGGAVQAHYDKHHLVPFGEYMPLSGMLDRIGLGELADGLVGGFTPGPGPRLISVPGLPGFQALICYEAVFPHEILRGANRPDWLVQITNDAWFGTWSGPYQHLSQARMRAIEQGLPLVRAANTGVSAVIDARGRVAASIPLGEEGHLDARVSAPLPPTPYARGGDLPVFAVLMALLGGCWLASRRVAPGRRA